MHGIGIGTGTGSELVVKRSDHIHGKATACTYFMVTVPGSRIVQRAGFLGKNCGLEPLRLAFRSFLRGNRELGDEHGVP